MPSVYDFTAQSLAGEEVPLKQFEGQVLLIVNTASACGFTPQYKGLQELHADLSPRGFAVLGFPCNQFGAQEPGSAAQIAQFCETMEDEPVLEPAGVGQLVLSRLEVGGVDEIADQLQRLHNLC